MANTINQEPGASGLVPTDSVLVWNVTQTPHTQHAPITLVLQAMSTLPATFASVKIGGVSLVPGPSTAQFNTLSSSAAANNTSLTSIQSRITSLQSRVAALEGGTPLIQVGNIGDQTTGVAFTVSGTITGVTSLPPLEYQDNSGTWISTTAAPESLSVNPISPAIAGVAFQVSGIITNANSSSITMQYQDTVNGVAGVWIAFPGGSTIGQSSYSFLHPAFSSASASVTVGVRDANATTITAVSNTFSVSTALANWYVATAANGGSDSNDGTAATVGGGHGPFLTIQKASTVAQPGQTVSVGSGDYPGGFSTQTSGTAGNPITYKSAVKWGARIVVPAGNGTESAWVNGGAHSSGGVTVGHDVIIDGFHVDGSTFTTGTNFHILIYMTGTNNTCRNCKVHDISHDSGGGGGGIMVDGYYGGTDFTVEGNVIYNITGTGPVIYNYQGIYAACNRSVIRNNLIINVHGGDCISSYHGVTQMYVSNNTCINGGIGIDVGSGGIAASNAQGGEYTQFSNSNGRFFNNILVDCGYGIYEFVDSDGAVSGNQYDHNLVFNSSSANVTINGSITNPVTSNPLFVSNTDTFAGNYHVQSGSPARNGGVASLSPAAASTIDLDGNVRPLGGTTDIGCYEYVE